jgi:hypothetical protein
VAAAALGFTRGRRKQRHERPAAAEAIEAVANCPPHSSPKPVAPIGQEEAERRATGSKGGLHERRELKRARDHRAEHGCAILG